MPQRGAPRALLNSAGLFNRGGRNYRTGVEFLPARALKWQAGEDYSTETCPVYFFPPYRSHLCYPAWPHLRY